MTRRLTPTLLALAAVATLTWHLLAAADGTPADAKDEWSADRGLALLRSADPEARLRGVRTLASGRRLTVAALPDLARALRAPLLNGHAARALALVGPDAVGPLRQLMRSDDYDTRRGAVVALELMGTPARAAAPDLEAALSDPTQVVRRHALRALVRLEPARAPGFVADLVGVVTDARLPAHRRWEALLLLGDLGTAARPALPELRALLARDDGSRTGPGDLLREAVARIDTGR